MELKFDSNLLNFIFPYFKLKLIDENHKRIRKSKINDYDLLILVETYRLEKKYLFNAWIVYISYEIYKLVSKFKRGEVAFTAKSRLILLTRVFCITNTCCFYFIYRYSKFINKT
jgi:hypothetical protein